MGSVPTVCSHQVLCLLFAILLFLAGGHKRLYVALRVGTGTYYYLQHSIRKGSHVATREIYFGRRVPKDIEEIKEKLVKSIYENEWYTLLHQIKRRYSKEIRQMPISSRKKEMNTFAIEFTYNTQRIEGSRLTDIFFARSIAE